MDGGDTITGLPDDAKDAIPGGGAVLFEDLLAPGVEDVLESERLGEGGRGGPLAELFRGIAGTFG